MSTSTLDRVEFDQEVAERVDDDQDFTGWWCVSTDEFPCPAPGCDFVARHMTAAHRVVVWPERDDRALLSYARDARVFGRNPRVVEYQRSMGPCIPFDRWKQLGNPVHGRHENPAGWDAATRGRL